MNKSFYILILCFLFLLVKGTVIAQPSSEYHFIYIDISKTERSNLQAYLSKLKKQLEGQKYIFFLSHGNKPVIAKDNLSFNDLLASISNITIVDPDISNDIDQINNVMSNDDFLTYNATKSSDERLKHKYKRVILHFFLDPGSFNTLNLNKYLIERLIAINYVYAGDKSININVYFDTDALSAIQKKNPEAFTHNEFNLIKY
jgi:hypothetical protein